MRAHRMGRILWIAALLVWPPEVAAQDLSVSIGSGWYNPGGDDFEKTDSGIGLDAVIQRKLSEQWRIGAGAQWNRHGVPFSEDDWTVWSLFVEPQLTLETDGRTAPLIGARAAWLRQAVDVSGGERTATGFGGGPFVGFRIALGEGSSLTLVAPLYGLWFGDYSIDGNERPDTDSSGRTFGLRVGFDFDLGGD
jgi:hypothetical protein